MERLIVERRALFLGARNTYSDAVMHCIETENAMFFEYAMTEEELIEKCYAYEPAMILSELTPANLNILMKVSRLNKYRHSVSIGITSRETEALRRLVTEFIITDIVVRSGNTLADALNVIRAFQNNIKFGVNVRAITSDMPMVTELCWHDVSWNEKLLRRSISDKLDRLGVKRELLGHKYLIAAVALQSSTATVPQPLKLYENIAAYYDTSAASVEKAIRYAIETAWTVGDIDYQHTVFGLTVDEERGKPTNAEFIARLALDF